MISYTHLMWNITWSHTWYHIHMISCMISYTYDIMYDFTGIWNHMPGIWYSTWCIIMHMMLYQHFIRNITWSHIWCPMCMMSYMMSYVKEVIYDVMCIWYHMFVVVISYMTIHFFSLVQMLPLVSSDAAQGQFKCNPIWIQCRPCSPPASVCQSWHQNRVAVVYYS